MRQTLTAFGSISGGQTNAVASARAVAAEYYIDFGLYGPTLTLYMSGLAQAIAAPTQPAIIEAWASATEGDAAGDGTMLGQLAVPSVGTAGVIAGMDGRLIIPNPGGKKYVTFTSRAGLNVATPVPLTFRGLLLSIDGPDGDQCTCPTTTLLQMRTGAKELSDKVNDLSVSDDTWNVWVNQGVERLWEMVTAAFSDHFFKSVDFTLIGGATGNFYDTTTIPAGDFRRVRLLEWQPDTSGRLKIRAFNFDQKDQQKGAFTTLQWCNERRYRLMGTKILIEPYEQAAGAYRLYYVPRATKLVSNCDGIDFVMDEWSEYPMLYAAIKALGKEESDPGQLQDQMAAIRAEIEIAAPSRNVGDADVISDVEDGDTGGGYFG